MWLAAPTASDVEDVRIWRNAEPQFLRTPYLLTDEMQEDFYRDVICNRDSRHRYYSLIDADDNGVKHLFGFGGLTNIEWENGRAEISLVMNPAVRGQGYGMQAAELLIREGFYSLRLETIDGEVYNCGNVGFWERVCDKYGAYSTDLLGRKYHHGILYDSMYFAISKYDYQGHLE